MSQKQSEHDVLAQLQEQESKKGHEVVKHYFINNMFRRISITTPLDITYSNCSRLTAYFRNSVVKIAKLSILHNEKKQITTYRFTIN